MDLGLSNKKAVVTGSTKGLGFATAKCLLLEGTNVMINGRSKDNIDESIQQLVDPQEPKKVDGFVGDVTNESTCQEIIQKTIAVFGGIDILITNSGGPRPGTFSNLSEKDWKDAIDLSFLSHLYLIRAALPYLKESDCPSVLAVASYTVKNPLDNMILSNTIRSATVALLKSLSFELGGYGIRFNSILPGWTHTGRVDALLTNRAKINASTVEKEKSAISSAIPLKRLGSPQEFAKAAVFLVSPAASYVNGIAMNVDGGITRGLF